MNATGWREGAGPSTDRLVLDPQGSRRHFELLRDAVPDDLGDRLAHTWVVSWDLDGREPYLARVLPQPHVHVTVEHDGAWLTGVPTGRFEYVVEGRGRVVGAALRPGGLRSWSPRPARELTGRRVPLQEVVALDCAALERSVAGADAPAAVAMLLRALRDAAHGPADEQSRLVAHVVDVVLADPGTRTVSQAASTVGVSVRTLQRLFADLVGVSPRWVLLRHRLHQVTGAIAAGQDGRWGELASEMGYADQSHFIRDFRSVVGMTPSAYAKACRASVP